MNFQTPLSWVVGKSLDSPSNKLMTVSKKCINIAISCCFLLKTTITLPNGLNRQLSASSVAYYFQSLVYPIKHRRIPIILKNQGLSTSNYLWPQTLQTKTTELRFWANRELQNQKFLSDFGDPRCDFFSGRVASLSMEAKLMHRSTVKNKSKSNVYIFLERKKEENENLPLIFPCCSFCYL